jgi:hypothetical protein
MWINRASHENLLEKPDIIDFEFPEEFDILEATRKAKELQ